MTAAAAFVLALLVSTAYGAAFHLILGGPPRKVAVYVMASWLGFALGHILGDIFDITLLRLGVLHLFTASLGSWIVLMISWVLGNR